MMNGKDRLDSVWEKINLPSFDPVKRNKLTEICVIGGGIAGLSTAYQLAKRGHEVTVIDSFALGSGQTSRTTAHLTSQLEGSLSELVKMHGMQVIKNFHEAHRMAIDEIEHVIDTESINCDFKRVDGYLLRSQNYSEEDLLRDKTSADGCGIPCAYTRNIPLFHEENSALKFSNQAQFNPKKYLRGLIKVMGELKVTFHEGTQISEIVASDPGMIVLKTENNYEIRARRVVVATDTPISNRFSIHTKQHPYRTYVAAFKMMTPKEKILLWDTEEPYHYVRISDDTLLVGGEDHHVGHFPPYDPFKKLEVWARENFSFIGEVVDKWSGQVYEPDDHLPFIGKAPGHQHVYLVSGAAGIGMTTGTIASLMLPDMIEGHTHPWAKMFDPHRSMRASVGEYLKENANVAFQYKDWITPSEVKNIEDISLDEGHVLREGLKKTCVYHETPEHFEKKSAVCTHLGGIVHWNDVEKTWDCPCHGSRFNVQGKVIEGPAISKLSEI